jgi:glutamate-1-semialdehyde aminotransferase
VRFVSSRSKADLYAMRAARAFSKRDKILKFEGGYVGDARVEPVVRAVRRSVRHAKV